MKMFVRFNVYLICFLMGHFSLSAMEAEKDLAVQKGLFALQEYAFKSREEFEGKVKEFDQIHSNLSEKIRDQLCRSTESDNVVDCLQKTFQGLRCFHQASIALAAENGDDLALAIFLSQKNYKVFINYELRRKTALLSAVLRKNIPAIKLLLTHNANPHQPFNGKSALEEAAELPLNTGVLQAFLEHSVNLNVHARFGKTLLMRFIEDKEMVELLLKNGANPNMQDATGRTVLHHICNAQVSDDIKNEIRALLKSHGADDKTLSQDGKSPYGAELHW